jgi:hypothetical protein
LCGSVASTNRDRAIRVDLAEARRQQNCEDWFGFGGGEFVPPVVWNLAACFLVECLLPLAELSEQGCSEPSARLAVAQRDSRSAEWEGRNRRRPHAHPHPRIALATAAQ